MTTTTDEHDDTMQSEQAAMVEAGMKLPGVAEVVQIFARLQGAGGVPVVSNETTVTFFSTGGNPTPVPA